MSLDVSKMINCDARFDKVLKIIIKDSSCTNIKCIDCPFASDNNIYRKGCGVLGGLNYGAISPRSTIIVNNAKLLLEYINKNSIDINKI